MNQQASGAKDAMERTDVFITRKDIVTFPFPYKLWLVVNLDLACLRWDRGGTVVLLDLVALESYLNSPRSIFKIKNCSTFLDHLKQFQFDRLNPTPEPDEDLLLQYKNENFQRKRRDLLARIRRQNEGAQPLSYRLQAEGPLLVGQQQTGSIRRISERMPDDLCFMSYGTMSNIQRKRMQLQTILDFHTMTKTLQERLQACSNAPGQMQKSDVIDLPEDTFENPLESVSRQSEDRAEYAGYYGNCSVEQVKRFFGDHLPKNADGSNNVEKIVIESHSTKPQNPSPKPIIPDVQQRYEEQHPSKMNRGSKVPAPIIPTALNQNSGNTTARNKNNCDTTSQNQHSGDTSASNQNINDLIEFIKFKDRNSTEVAMETEHPTTSSNTVPLSQITSGIQMEITDDDSSNESSFENFFHRYRSAVDLLYEGL